MNKHRLRLYCYLGGFLLNLGVAFAAYVNSSFVEQFVGERSVGLIYVIIALLSILISFNADSLIKKIGNRRALVFLTLTNLFVIALLLWYRATPFALLFFIVYSVLNFLTAINLDLYLEEISDDRTTGRIRGLFLTLINLAWLASPLLAGLLVEARGLAAVYLVSGLAFSPLALLVKFILTDIPHEQARFERAGIYPTLRKLWRGKEARDRDLRHTIMLDFLLNFFYAVMLVYTPIYLHEHIGLAWNQIGLVMTMALVPFVVLDFFLGWLADTWLGERELIIAGLLVMAGATLLLPLLRAPNVLLWGAILFLTRVGAATLEMMKEAYLFKKIDGRDIDIVFISRNTSPLAYLVAPLLATLWLSFFSLQYLFAPLALILLLGLPVAFKLRDTK